jgi:hypothetical protein
VKQLSDGDENQKPNKLSEREKLEQEKIMLAKEIGIWGESAPVENYKETPQHKRINEIDKRLWELVKSND